jgi:beta-galactosidase
MDIGWYRKGLKFPESYADKKIFIVFDGSGNIVGEFTSSKEIHGLGEEEFVQYVDVKSPHFWDIDDPYLYKAYSIVKIGNKVVDTEETTFGIRTFHFDANKGFFLNGMCHMSLVH